MEILIKFLAAHLLGDFTLQSGWICKLKHSNIAYDKHIALTIHSAIQAVLTYLFIGCWANWLVPLIIFASHYAIDFIKVTYTQDSLRPFLMDQISHYAVILLIWWFEFGKHRIGSYNSDWLISYKTWIIATSYIAVLAPTSILIKKFMDYEKWMPNASFSGLPNAGKWIGYIERVLILTFIFTGNVEGIGFLLTAKSVFRFGELNHAKDIKITEYVLIGTFTSFAIAILIGFAAKWLINLNCERVLTML